MQDQPIEGSPRASFASGYTVLYAVKVLERLALRPYSAPELADLLALSVPTVRRIVNRLRVENYLVQDGGRRKRYRPTLRLAAIGLEVVRRAPLPRLADPLLADLAQQTTARAHLWIAGPSEPIDIARPVMTVELEPAAPATAANVLAPGRDHLRSVALVRDAGRWTVVVAVMHHGRVAAAIGLSGCEDLLVTRSVVDLADRLEQDLAETTKA